MLDKIQAGASVLALALFPLLLLSLTPYNAHAAASAPASATTPVAHKPTTKPSLHQPTANSHLSKSVKKVVKPSAKIPSTKTPRVPVKGGSVTLRDQLELTVFKMENGEIGMTVPEAAIYLRGRSRGPYEDYLANYILAMAYERISGSGSNTTRAAIGVYAGLLKNFPQYAKKSLINYKIAVLYYKIDQPSPSLKYLSEMGTYSDKGLALDADILHANLMVKLKDFASARTRLLGILIRPDIPQVYVNRIMASLANIDFLQGNFKMAVKRFEKIRNYEGGWDEVVKSPVFYSAYIRSLHHLEKDDVTVIKDYLSRHYRYPESRPVRLVLADLLAEQGKTTEALTNYRILISSNNDSVSKAAEIRSLVLTASLVPTRPSILDAIKRVNELRTSALNSDIEDEASLYIARLYRILSENYKGDYISPAIGFYALAAYRGTSRYSNFAYHEGGELLTKYMSQLMSNKEYSKAALVYRHYTQLQRTVGARLSAGHAYIQLGAIKYANEIIAELSESMKKASSAERDGYDLLRATVASYDPSPASLKITRNILTREGMSNNVFVAISVLLARQLYDLSYLHQSLETLDSLKIKEKGIDHEVRLDYWRLKEELYTSFNNWTAASYALAARTDLAKKSSWSDISGLITMLIRDDNCARAKSYMKKVPEEERKAEWYYQSARCAFKGGKYKEASALIKASTKTPDYKKFESHINLLKTTMDVGELKRRWGNQ